MKLIFDGLTQRCVIPADPAYYADFTIQYRPLAGYELQQWRQATGPAQVGLILSKLQSWNLVCDAATAAWMMADPLRNMGVTYTEGSPLPITAEVLKVLPSSAFEAIYLACMGLLMGLQGKTGEQETRDAAKN